MKLLRSLIWINEPEFGPYTVICNLNLKGLADALGLSNEHVCRIPGKLANGGVIEINHHALKVLD
jgi:hypothetical protein